VLCYDREAKCFERRFEMAGKDFFDEDLVKHRDEIKRIKMGPADQPARTASPDPLELSGSAAAGGDFNLTRMMHRKQQMAGESARTTEELERLRSRQSDLEQQKKALESLRSRISEYEAGKGEMLERIAKSIISLEKQEVKANAMAGMLGSTRMRFRELRIELMDLDESSWDEEEFREELGKALTTIDNARMEFNQAIANIEAANEDQRASRGKYEHVDFAEPAVPPLEEKSMMDWVRIGFAVSLPLIVVFSIIIVLIIIYFAQSGYFGWF
jgi:DNA repair exonuclease SbcCD ATPase subunit